MKTKSSKAKGRRLQNWVAEQISLLTGFSWGRDQAIEPRIMGQSGVDVRLSEAALALFPFSVEAKNVERLSFWPAVHQARGNQLPNTDWLLFIKKNNEQPVAVMGATAFFDLLKEGS